jgi:hypothetical protein
LLSLLSKPGDVVRFACLGFPLAPADQRDRLAYLPALGYDRNAEVLGVGGWRDAIADAALVRAAAGAATLALHAAGLARLAGEGP